MTSDMEVIVTLPFLIDYFRLLQSANYFFSFYCDQTDKPKKFTLDSDYSGKLQLAPAHKLVVFYIQPLLCSPEDLFDRVRLSSLSPF